MSGFEARAAGHPGAGPHEFDDWRWSVHRSGPPLPLMILGVVVAFWFFKPLGVVALAYLVWRFARARGGCAFRREGFRRSWEPGAWGGPRRGPAAGNSAFEEHRLETLKELDEEANAFGDFARRQHEAHDREAFDRFLAERTAPKGSGEPRVGPDAP